MSSFVINSARALGSGIGSNIGARLAQTAGQFALSYANQTVASLLDTRRFEGPRFQTFHVMTSQDGAPMPLTYGRVRLAGQLIWASRLNEQSSESRVGSKGGPKRTDYSYSISFAVGLCEGVIESVDRLWVNGAPISLAGLNMRVYKGTSEQLPDPLLAAIEGADIPAFKDTAYIVFEDFPLDDYGARLPQINAEVTRRPPVQDDSSRLETQISGIHLLPSSGEFVYDTDVIEDVSNPGEAKPINLNNLSGEVDIIRALNQLETALPNCRNVSLVVSWFGTDLRAEACRITPGVETQSRLLEDGISWRVSGVERERAYVVSQNAKGRPNYGGTPSDSSIIKAISLLKSRGYKVSFYPFILMDIPKGNGLPDPYGEAEQAAFPWRGRVSCHPAIGQEMSADQTQEAANQVEAFFGTALASQFSIEHGEVNYIGDAPNSFRHFILHYAHLCQLAGGVERFIIGSEMVGLTTIRSSRTQFPAVDKFIALSDDVRAILGVDTHLSYAADWSEYYGYHPQDGTGDVHFHLDPLWANGAIDAVAIDAYFPLSDWRDGESHLDTGAASGRYDLNYLMRNIEGGEGYDWYYVNPDDRLLQERTTIVDTAYGKDWVFRYKDMRNWWRHRHYTRLGGVETGPTAWQAQSKPIWLMEIGCPAVDKGANQPNVFFDPKSDESHLPYFSNGARDDTIQRLYLQAVLRYWSGAENPISEIYNAPMIDMESSHIWCWDARPFPDFPARETVWSDGPNWERGHWLCGRVGLVQLRDVVYDLSLRADIKSADVSKITGVIEGYSLDRPMSPRAAIEPLSLAYGFDMAETATGLRFIPQTGATTKTISLSDMGADIPSETKEDRESLLKDVRLHYIDAGRDYQSAVISAKDLSAESVQIVDIPTPIAMDAALAKSMASRILLRSQTSDRQINFTLSPNALDVNVGDVVILPNIEGAWQVEIISEDGLRSVSAKFHDNDLPLLDFDRSVPAVDNPPIWWPKPSPLIVDVPKLGSAVRSGPLIGASARPFAPVLFAQGQSQAQSLRPIYRGELLTPLTSGPVGRWDRAAQFEMSMPYLKLASVSEADLLSGANQFAVKTETGWEVMAAQTIVLEEGGAYRCSNLLRGLSGSEAEIMTVIPSGTDIIWLGEGLVNLSLSNDFIDSEIRATATMAGRVSESAPVIYKAKHLRPFAPVHGKIIPTEVGVKLSWIGREQGFDDWGASSVDRHAVFRITLLGEEAETLRYEVQGYETFLADSLLHDFSEITIEQGAEDYGFGPSLRLRL